MGNDAGADGDPRSALGTAWRAFGSADFANAVRRFEAIRKSEPAGSRNYLMATYGLATTWALRRPGQDAALAEQFHQEILNAGAAGELKLWVRLDRAEILACSEKFSAGDRKTYNLLLEEIVALDPGHPAAAEATLKRELDRLSDAGKPEAQVVIEHLKKYLAAYPDIQIASAFHFVMAQAYRLLEQPVQELDSLITGLETWDRDPRSPKDDRSRIYWQIAVLADFRAGRPDIARQFYERLIAEFPLDNRVFFARGALSRLGATVVESKLPPF